MKIRFKKDVAGHSAGDTKHIVSSIDWAMTYGDMLADGLIEVIPEYDPYEPKKAWSDLDMQDFAYYVWKSKYGTPPGAVCINTMETELRHWKNRVVACSNHPRVEVSTKKLVDELDRLMDEGKNYCRIGSEINTWYVLKQMHYLIKYLVKTVKGIK